MTLIQIMFGDLTEEIIKISFSELFNIFCFFGRFSETQREMEAEKSESQG